MTRDLYRLLLELHPFEFRYRFAEEMLWIFDEAGESEGRGNLILDACISLARQRFLRSSLWKFGAGLAVNAAFAVLSIIAQQRSGPPHPVHASPAAVVDSNRSEIINFGVAHHEVSAPGTKRRD